MIFSSNLKAVLDACVLYPAPVRDLLLSVANEGLFKPKWTHEIHSEWTRNLLANRNDINQQQLSSTTNAMNKAFPDANIQNYESLIQSITLPDLNDRHVVAAAIRSRSDLILTFNLKHFPVSLYYEYGLEVQHPDFFLSDLFDLNPDTVHIAFIKQVKRLKRPPMTNAQVLNTLEKCGLKNITGKIKSLRQ